MVNLETPGQFQVTMQTHILTHFIQFSIANPHIYLCFRYKKSMVNPEETHTDSINQFVK